MIRIEKAPLLKSLRLLRKYTKLHDSDIYALYLDSLESVFDSVVGRRSQLWGLSDLLNGYMVFRPNASNESVFALLELVGITVVDSGDAQ